MRFVIYFLILVSPFTFTHLVSSETKTEIKNEEVLEEMFTRSTGIVDKGGNYAKIDNELNRPAALMAMRHCRGSD